MNVDNSEIGDHCAKVTPFARAEIIRNAIEQANQNRVVAQTKNAKHYNKKRRDFRFTEGDVVLKRTHYQSKAGEQYCSKLDKTFEGPYRIDKATTHSYKLCTIDKGEPLKGTYSIGQLKPFYARDEADGEIASEPVIVKPRRKPKIVRPPRCDDFHMKLRSRNN